MLPLAGGVAMRRTNDESESHLSHTEKGANCRLFQPFQHPAIAAPTMFEIRTEAFYNRPSSARMRMMIRISPRIPPGP